MAIEFDNSVDYYQVLGVSRSADRAEIRLAYRRRALELHPDNNPDRREQAGQEFQRLLEAFEVLSDRYERHCYDVATGHGTGRALSPAELARMGVATAGTRMHPAAEDASAPGGRRPTAWAVLALAGGVMAVSLAWSSQTAALLIGVGAMAAASRALSATGTFRLSLLSQRLAVIGRFAALLGIALSTSAWALQACVLVIDYALRRWPRGWAELRVQPPMLILWACLTVVGFVWASASRGRFSRERQRWREYRFLFVLLAVGLGMGVASNVLASAWAGPYYAYLQAGPEALSDAPPPVNVGWVALQTGLDSTWKIGLALGLAVLGANSPSPRAPQLDYAYLKRRMIGPVALVGGAMTLGAIFGATGLFGKSVFGFAMVELRSATLAVSAWGMHIGEFVGVLFAAGWVIVLIVTERRERARVVRYERFFSPQRLLTDGP